MHVIGIFCYKKEQYKEFLKISTNREKMDPTWEDWLESKKKAKRGIEEQGVTCIDVEVDIFDLMDFCQKHGLEINGDSRAKYVTDFLNSGNS